MAWTRPRRAVDEKEALLAQSPVLGRLRPDGIRWVARRAELVDGPAGTVLHEAGERVACWWLVLDGVVRVGGAVVAAGDGWGAEAALGGRPTADRAVAVTPVRALAVDRARLVGLLQGVPELAIILLRDRRTGAAA